MKTTNKIIVIGDIHGYNTWETIVNKHKDAVVIFIGDYVDSFGVDPVAQLHNLNKIIAFKKVNPQRTFLLFGNHDLHYICNVRYSGHQMAMQHDFEKLFYDNLELFQVCKVIGERIFSHAGITNTWCEENGIDMDDLEDSINMCLFTGKGKSALGIVGGHPYGDSVHASPVWVRPMSLKEDHLMGYTHIFGHTHRSNVSFVSTDDDKYLINTDCLPNEYLVIDKIERAAAI